MEFELDSDAACGCFSDDEQENGKSNRVRVQTSEIKDVCAILDGTRIHLLFVK